MISSKTYLSKKAVHSDRYLRRLWEAILSEVNHLSFAMCIVE